MIVSLQLQSLIFYKTARRRLVIGLASFVVSIYKKNNVNNKLSKARVYQAIKLVELGGVDLYKIHRMQYILFA